MNKILLINACVRKESRTMILANELLKILDGEVYEENLEKNNLLPFTEEMLNKRDELLNAKAYSDKSLEFANRFAKADYIVIAAPYWDLSFPSNVKVYIEHIMVNGVTFTYSEQGYPIGLCQAKKLYYISTAGGPVIGENEGYRYIKELAEKLWGIKECKLFQAENLDVVGADVEKILGDIKEMIRAESKLK